MALDERVLTREQVLLDLHLIGAGMTLWEPVPMPDNCFRRFSSLALAAGLICMSVSAYAAAPQFPCQADAQVDYPMPGSKPKIETWGPDDLSVWSPPSCSGWSKSPSNFLIVLKGTFHSNASIDEIAKKLGAISHLSDIHYWSVTDKEWRPLVKASSALSAPNKKG